MVIEYERTETKRESDVEEALFMFQAWRKEESLMEDDRAKETREIGTDPYDWQPKDPRPSHKLFLTTASKNGPTQMNYEYLSKVPL